MNCWSAWPQPRLPRVVPASGPAWAVAIAAVLRGSYHLHQGIGPFIGNVILGVIFSVLFLRWRRTNPMIIAHALINSVAFIGYMLLAGHVSWLP